MKIVSFLNPGHERCGGGVKVNVLGDVALTDRLVREAAASAGEDAIADIARLLHAPGAPTILNFEGVIGEKLRAREKGLPSLYSLISPPSLLNRLAEDLNPLVVGLANNHVADFGEAGIEATLRATERSGVPHGGLGKNVEEALRPAHVRAEERRIAALFFTNLAPAQFIAGRERVGVAPLRANVLGESVRKAREDGAETIIVSLHVVADLRDPFRFSPDDIQREWAHRAIDAGADLVVGHQPHGVQKIEWYRGGGIMHSLGPTIYDPALTKYVPPGTRRKGNPFLAYGGAIGSATFCTRGLCSVALTCTKPRLSSGRICIAPRSSAFHLFMAAKQRLPLPRRR